jgi:ABC-type multidrug transport system ATPase subunit
MHSLTHTGRDAGPTLEVSEMQVRLGARRLMMDRHCTLRAGRLHLIVGPSGSGKSAFARALLGFGDLSDPTIVCQGKVTVTDAGGQAHTLWDESGYNPAARQHIAFLPQAERLGFLDGLSLADNLGLFSLLAAPVAATEAERLAKQFRLSPLPTALASASGGERIRLSAIRGLLPRRNVEDTSAVVIADEPTAGLDRASARSMADSLLELAHSGQTVVMVITHEPELFLEHASGKDWIDERAVKIIECRFATAHGEPVTRDAATHEVARLELVAVTPPPRPMDQWLERAAESLSRLGAVALSPLAFIWGLLGLHRPLVLLKQVLVDASGPGTQVFSLAGCLLIAGTVAYFIFERMPKPELVEPLLLPETLGVTGHALVRVVLPLGACGLVTTKLGAAQAARLAAAVRAGLLETLAMAGWRIEAYALVPAVVAQLLAMALATVLALIGGVFLAAVVHVAGHGGDSLPLTINLMIDGLRKSPHWTQYAIAKVALSAFLGGTIAALFGSAPSRAEDDVARAVHRTLFWGVLAVIACQCALIIAEFTP